MQVNLLLCGINNFTYLVVNADLLYAAQTNTLSVCVEAQFFFQLVLITHPVYVFTEKKKLKSSIISIK